MIEWLPIREYFWQTYAKTFNGSAPFCPRCTGYSRFPTHECFNKKTSIISLEYHFKCEQGHEWKENKFFSPRNK